MIWDDTYLNAFLVCGIIWWLSNFLLQCSVLAAVYIGYGWVNVPNMYLDIHDILRNIGIFYILFKICIMTLRSKGRKYYLGFFTCACVPNNWTGYICKTGQNKESLRSMLAKM